MLRTILRDDQWDRIAGLLPGQAMHPGRTAADNRVFVEAVLWILRPGAPGRDLPDAFGHWHSGYRRLARWQIGGVWDAVLSALAQDADFEDIFIDSSVIRVHQQGAGAAKKTAAQDRALARWREYQDPRGRRRPRQPGARPPDGWAGARCHPSRAVAREPAHPAGRRR